METSLQRAVGVGRGAGIIVLHGVVVGREVMAGWHGLGGVRRAGLGVGRGAGPSGVGKGGGSVAGVGRGGSGYGYSSGTATRGWGRGRGWN